MEFLHKITIRSRIVALFVLSILLFTLFGAFALQRLGTLAELTKTLYEHPLQVSNAALRAQSGIMSIHRNIKDVILSQSQLEANRSIQEIQDDEKEVYRDLALVKELILGEEGKKLAQETIDMFAGWKPRRMEVEELVLKGDKAAALEMHQKNATDLVKRLERQTNELSSYANKKADGFMANAEEVRQQTVKMVVLAICLVTFFCFCAAFIVINSITRSLGTLKDKMAAGTSSGVISMVEVEGKNEIADLAVHYNGLVTVVGDQLWLRDKLNELGRILSGNISFDELTGTGISFVSRTLDACAGVFYLYDRAEAACNLTASYAFVERKFLANRFLHGEGVIGQVAVEKKPIMLKNISRDEACANSGTVSEPPQNIYAVPILFEHELLGVIEIATFEALTPMKKQFVDEAVQIIASQLNISLQNRQIQDLYRISQAANEELQTKTDQINISNNELSALNKELQAQASELQAQRDELQAQTVELEKKRFQVEEADKLKSEFLSNMSHELRTPLNSIMSLSQLMISRGIEKDPGKATEYLRVIDRNGRQLLNLINDILDLTKIESGRMDIFPTKFETRQVVERILETARPLADKKGLQLDTHIEGESVLFSDEDKVYQILLNFFSNAIKFTEKGTVTLHVKEADRKVFFIVSDSGIGISAGDQGSIFDEFRQVDGSFTREHEGTGLGLAISKKLTALLGGEITVASTPGAGSTFTLALPLTFHGESLYADIVSEPPPPAIPSSGRSGPPRILVVEDNEIASMQICAALQDNGFEVVVAKDGAEGLEHVRQDMPDAIVLDLMMPKVDGFQVLEQIRSWPETAALPVLILTAKEISAAERSRLMHNNIVQLVQKGSTDREQLVASVKKMLSPHKGEGAHICKNAPGFPPPFQGEGRGGDGVDCVISESYSKQPHPHPNLPLEGEGTKNSKSAFMPRKGTESIQAEAAAGGKAAHSGAGSILLVEDNADNRLTVSAILEGNRYELYVAEDGEQGVRMVRELLPDIILMDIQLPVMDGIQAIKIIKSDPATRHIPIIAVSARAMKGEKEVILAAGADDYVPKPINPDELLEKVRKWMT